MDTLGSRAKNKTKQTAKKQTKKDTKVPINQTLLLKVNVEVGLLHLKEQHRIMVFLLYKNKFREQIM